MTSSLQGQHCGPCQKGIPPLSQEEITPLLAELGPSWTVIDNKKLEKTYKFANFIEALAFTNKVGALAEKQGHHPDIILSYGKVILQLQTHKIHGLSKNDFILAIKCDALL